MFSLFLISFAAAEQFFSPTIAVKLGTDFPGRSLPISTPKPPTEPKMSFHEEDLEYIDQLEKYYGNFERSIDSLPRYSNVSADRIPWPGSAWATTKGTDSSVKKYARAFNLNYAKIRDAVSARAGVDSLPKDSRTCEKDTDCFENEECALKRDAWCPAAIMEKEPGCPITRNGETFNSNDLKGLITMIYDGSDIETVFTGLRCDITKPSFDTYGRYNRKECRDISPDFLHLAMTNLIGIRNRAFVIDLEAKSPVWNQPVLGYSVDKLEKLSISEAGRLFGERRYSFNDDANALYHVKTRFFWINESEEAGPLIKNGRVNAYILAENYEYVLEVDSKNRIVGGEWVGKSMANHPDFLWVPITGPRMDTVVLEGISYTEVRSMIEESYRTNC